MTSTSDDSQFSADLDDLLNQHFAGLDPENSGHEGEPEVKPTVKVEDIIKARRAVSEVYIDEKVERYIVDLVFATRQPADYGLDELAALIGWGASPRASIYLTMTAKAHAFLNRRGYVVPEDVRAVFEDGSTGDPHPIELPGDVGVGESDALQRAEHADHEQLSRREAPARVDRHRQQ